VCPAAPFRRPAGQRIAAETHFKACDALRERPPSHGYRRPFKGRRRHRAIFVGCRLEQLEEPAAGRLFHEFVEFVLGEPFAELLFEGIADFVARPPPIEPTKQEVLFPGELKRFAGAVISNEMSPVLSGRPRNQLWPSRGQGDGSLNNHGIPH
jgi:hypothetical protein